MEEKPPQNDALAEEIRALREDQAKRGRTQMVALCVALSVVIAFAAFSLHCFQQTQTQMSRLLWRLDAALISRGYIGSQFYE